MTSTVRPPAGRAPRPAGRRPAARAATGDVRAPAEARHAERPVEVGATGARGGLRQAVREDPPRPRTGVGLLLLPPWRRAPLLPFGQPAVILAVVAATAILACASSSAALFLSSASSASLQRLVGAECPEGASVGLQTTALATSEPTLTARVGDALRTVGLAPPRLSLLAPATYVLGDGRPVRLVYRDGALDHVTRVAGSRSAPGMWVSEAAAQQADVGVGDRVALGAARVPIAGIYRNLFQEPPKPFWCSYRHLIFNLANANQDPPPLAIATDPAVFAEVAGDEDVAYTWESPVGGGVRTLSGGRDLADRQAEAYRIANLPELQDFGRQNSGAGQLPQLTERAALIRDGLRGPVLPIALGGTLLALLLVGAAGSYWADRRYAEVRLLSARGVGPGPLAGKAVLELALPAAIGTVLGWALSRWLVSTFGPSPDLDAAASRLALLVAVAGLVAGLALLGLVAGLRARNATERPVGRRRSRLVALPWELVLLAGAAVSYRALRGGEAVRVVENVAQVDLLVVVFPLLFILGGSVLAVRLLALLLPLLAGRAGRLPAAWYLAARRLTAARVASVVLLAAAATPVAMAVYSAGLTSGSAQTLVAKARVFTGADVAVLSNDPLRRTADTDRIGTVVVRYLYGTVGGVDVALLAVDPETLGRTAYWRSGFADQPLPELLAALSGPAPAGRLPALVVDPRRELAGAATADLRVGKSEVRVARAAEARLFPGRRLPVPMILVDRTRLGAVDPHAGSRYELWTRGPATPAEAAVLGQDASIFDTVEERTIFQAADYLGITWTFGYLAALAVLVGLVSIGALLLYLETRQRSRTASYALGRRMGLSRATHLRSLLAELGLLLGVAYVAGAVLGQVALGLVNGLLDVDPSRPPPPLLVLPVAALAGAATVVTVVTVLTALYAQRAADRTPPAEVLRLT